MRTELGEMESQLIQLTRRASVGGQLEDTIHELAAFPTRIRPHFAQLAEWLERRDLSYEDMARLEEGRKRILWLYRRSRLEHIFFSKLRLERTLRDTLYRQILEGYDEFSAMETLEARVRTVSEEALATELLREGTPETGVAPGGSEG